LTVAGFPRSRCEDAPAEAGSKATVSAMMLRKVEKMSLFIDLSRRCMRHPISFVFHMTLTIIAHMPSAVAQRLELVP
jgi:hypothetical protein